MIKSIYLRSIVLVFAIYAIHMIVLKPIWINLPISLRIVFGLNLIFTPFLYGYPFRYFMLKRRGQIKNGDIRHSLTNISGTSEYSVNYDVFGPLKPWAYVHGEYVFGAECGVFGIMYAAFFCLFGLIWLMKY